MPMQRDRYAPNWDEIALGIKEAAGWVCDHCGRPCRRPSETEADFEARLQTEHPEWYPGLFAEEPAEGFGFVEVKKFARFVLTVAHLDQNPSNDDPSNHAALCAPCHLAYDRPFRQYNRRRKLERQGQLSLLEGTSHA